MNRILLEKVRYILIGSGLPKSFWGEAITIAAYHVNRCPFTAIKLKTLDEL